MARVAPPPDPRGLLGQAKAGCVHARGQLLELYRGYLTILARVQIGRRLQGKFEAADLVQDTFLEAHRDFGQFRGASETEFVGWLKHILASNLANLVRRYCKTRCRDVRLERELAAELDHSSAALDQSLVDWTPPSQHLAQQEQTNLVADALQRLPEDYREVVLLRHFERLSFAEAAQRMGRSVDGVEKLWVRALARLRRALTRVAENEG